MKLVTVWAELRVVLIILVVSSLIGFVSGYWAISVVIGLLIFILWHLRQLYYLREWISLGLPVDATPNLYGTAYQMISKICDVKKVNSRQRSELEAILNRFDAATKAMPDAMLIINQSQSIEWANPAAKTLLGIDLFRDIGQRIDNIVRDPDIVNYLSNSDFDEPLEFSSTKSSENDLLLKVVSYDDGKKLLIVHDHRDLHRLQQVRKAFVSNASHEMRTPLTVIIGYLETLTLREELNPVTRRGVDGALEQAERLKQLIEDLLSLSRLESLPLSKSHSEKVDLKSLVYESVELIKSSAIYKGQIFSFSIEDAIINGDYRELQSAIQNILDNAVKYSPENSAIEIEWANSGNQGAKLVVRDYGEGIDALHIPRLTERFYRIDKGRSRDMGGTGLGLSIVKHVMERHGGELIINSTSDLGTTIELMFPLERTFIQSQRASA